MIGRGKSVAVAEADQRAVLRALDQPQLGFEHDHARALCADQRARHVESVFRQQLIEVVAGDAPGNFRELRADQAGVLIANVAQLGIDLAAPPALRDDGIAVRPRRPSRRPSFACRHRAGCAARRRCRPSCRRAGNACRRNCFRSFRRACSGCAWTDQGRTSVDASPRGCAACRERRRAGRARIALRDRSPESCSCTS